MKLIVDLIYQSGFAGMRYSISNTAEYGDYITVTKDRHRRYKESNEERIFPDIQDGTFAKDWLLENKIGAPHFHAMRAKGAQHESEVVGAELRKL